MRLTPSALLLLLAALVGATPCGAAGWSDAELAVLRSLWIGSLPAPPPEPGNPLADDARAAAFGHRLFFDVRLSANGQVACATCHVPARSFTDGLPVSRGIGAMRRNAPSVVGAAWSPWLFWDGRKDSLWSQALGPLENPVEHGMSRAGVVALITGDAGYRRRYAALFGGVPAAGRAADEARVLADLGRVIAAYERRLRPGPARFDRYVAALLRGDDPAPQDRLDDAEIRGLRLFVDGTRGQCVRCHGGPLFTDHGFHNTGVAEAGDDEVARRAAEGRPAGFRELLSDEFACLGPRSGAPPSACADVVAASAESGMPGAFKTPSLRNVARTAPYMRTGRFPTLEAALDHYRRRPPAPVGRSEIVGLDIAEVDIPALAAFLRTLDGPVAAPPDLLAAPR